MAADPRVTPLRPDLAASSLEGRIAADRYADPAPMQTRLPVAGLRYEPARTAELADQLLFGELFDVLDSQDGWVWGQARRDGYVGWVRLEALSAEIFAPTHRVSALRAFAFSEPGFKTLPVGRYSMNALVAVEAEDDRYLKLAGSGWMVREHLAPIGTTEDDPVAVAERYLDTPYLWGGRDSHGLDCSGLVQQALYACGQACPRDSDQQAAALGRKLGGAETLQRGDLVFWPRHVGVMVDSQRLLHANSHHMATVIEPLEAHIARAGPVIARKRL